MRRSTRQCVLRPLAVYGAQIPILVAYVLGVVPIHPIATVMPLVVFLNARFDRRGPKGLGLRPPSRPLRWMLLVLVFVLLGVGGQLAVLRLEGIRVHAPSLTAHTVGALARDFTVGVLIIALWEEIVSRGYIQTRLQEAWGFRGVLVATLLFASLHVPSAVHNYGRTSVALLRIIHVSLGGFMLGYVYWRARSVLVTIALHGLRNVLALSLIVHLSDVTVAELQASQMGFQLLWLVGQVGLMIVLCAVLFGRRPAMARRPQSRFLGGLWSEPDQETAR